MAILLNNFGLCASDYIGAGMANCRETNLGIPKGIGVIQTGYKNPIASGTFDEVVFRQLITDGKLHQLIGVFGFEDTTGEDQIETSNDQVSIVTQNALPMFTFTYKNGYVFNQALQSLKGFANWDVFIYTTKGIFMATDYAKANIKGFNCGMFQPTGYKLTSGSVREFSTVKMQFLDADEFNQRGTFFSYDELGFSALEIDDPIQTVVTYETAPSNADTEVTVYVKDFGNASTDLNSLFTLVTDYVVKINGVAETVNSVTVNGSHNILEFTTALATSDVVTVSLNGVVEDVNLNYYKSNTLSAVVVA